MIDHNTAGDQVHIIGPTTERLPYISRPRDVVVTEVAGAVQAQIDALAAAGVSRIILISHLQSILEDLALAAQLRGLDVMIAGGGDELLANPPTSWCRATRPSSTAPIP